MLQKLWDTISAIRFLKNLSRLEEIDENVKKINDIERKVNALFDKAYGFEAADGYASQLNADLWILTKTGYKRNGFFVEFGAHDGRQCSNTLLLETAFNWNGILIEPNKELYDLCKKNRESLVLNEFIFTQSGVNIDFINAGTLGTAVQYADGDCNAQERRCLTKSITKMTSISLQDLLVKYDCPHTIDYMSIDTEGSEFDILKNFPFHKWNIENITIEHAHRSNRENIFNLMAQNGYARIKRFFDDWYSKTN